MSTGHERTTVVCNNSPTPKLGGVGAAPFLFVAVGGVLACTVAVAGASSVAGQSAPAALVALNGDTSGNDPRTVGAVDDCVSACVREVADIDIVIPSPAVPADRGIAAFQFTTFYDPVIVWISAGDLSQVLGRAGGSNVVPIACPKPDTGGIYRSWAVDFGPKAVEPAGASEVGPGVIARATPAPRGFGASPLILQGCIHDRPRLSNDSCELRPVRHD